MDQVELEVDLEAEEMVEAEGSEAIGMEEYGTMGGTQSSVMEVEEEGEDEVVVIEEVNRGGDKETGTVVAAQIVKEESLSRDGDTNASVESG